MIYRLIIFCIIILAVFYYFSIIMQLLFPDNFKIITKEIKFYKAMIPFYYWLCKKD